MATAALRQQHAEMFGHGKTVGMWFVRGNVMRDLLALGKVEVSPWDTWRCAPISARVLNQEEVSLCDGIAVLTQGSDDRVGGRELFEEVKKVDGPPWLT